jgi:hypothetical protein
MGWQLEGADPLIGSGPVLSVLADLGQFLVVANQRERGGAGLLVRVAGRSVTGVASVPSWMCLMSAALILSNAQASSALPVP